MIGDLVAGYARTYVAELRAIAAGGEEAIGSLTLDTTDGVLRDVLQRARLNTRVGLLDEQTMIEDYDRRFAMSDGVYPSTRRPAPRSRRRSRRTCRRCRRGTGRGRRSTASRTS